MIQARKLLLAILLMGACGLNASAQSVNIRPAQIITTGECAQAQDERVEWLK